MNTGGFSRLGEQEIRTEGDAVTLCFVVLGAREIGENEMQGVVDGGARAHDAREGQPGGDELGHRGGRCRRGRRTRALGDGDRHLVLQVARLAAAARRDAFRFRLRFRAAHVGPADREFAGQRAGQAACVLQAQRHVLRVAGRDVRRREELGGSGAADGEVERARRRGAARTLLGVEERRVGARADRREGEHHNRYAEPDSNVSILQRSHLRQHSGNASDRTPHDRVGCSRISWGNGVGAQARGRGGDRGGGGRVGGGRGGRAGAARDRRLDLHRAHRQHAARAARRHGRGGAADAGRADRGRRGRHVPRPRPGHLGHPRRHPPGDRDRPRPGPAHPGRRERRARPGRHGGRRRPRRALVLRAVGRADPVHELAAGGGRRVDVAGGRERADARPSRASAAAGAPQAVIARAAPPCARTHRLVRTHSAGHVCEPRAVCVGA